MKRRIIWNDIKENKLLATTTWFFMTLCAIMFAVTCFLFVKFIRFHRCLDGKRENI